MRRTPRRFNGSPTTPAGSRPRTGVQALRWLGTGPRWSSWAGLATIRQPVPTCALDTIVTGLKVDLLDLSRCAPVPRSCRAPTSPPGVSAGASSDEVYFTSRRRHARLPARALDRRDPAWRTTSGAAGIARDVHVAGGTARGCRRRPGRISSVDPTSSARCSGTAGAWSTSSTWPPTRTWPSTEPAPLPPPRALARPATGSWPRVIRSSSDLTRHGRRHDRGRAGDLFLFAAP